jgi:hypothetical protein
MSSLERIREFISKQKWQLAKSMPQAPHWFVRRNNNNSISFNNVDYIKNNGEFRRWGSFGYIYLDVDTFTYWTMNNSEGETTIINRAELQANGDINQKLDMKKCPNCKRLTLASEYKKFEVRTNGVTKIFWRCPVCEEFKLAAKKAALKK